VAALKAISPKTSYFSIVVTLALILLVGFYLILIGYTYFHYNPGSLFELISTPEISHAIVLSLLCATAATLLALLFSIPSSYVLSRKDFPGKMFIDTLLDIPVFVSPVALGALLLVFFSSPLSKGFQQYLFPIVFAVPGIVIAQFTVVAGLSVRLMKSTFDQIPSRYEEVARTLGCSPFQAFCKVTLPLAKNGILASAIISWARAIGEFGATITLVGAAEMKTETVPTAVYLSFASADIDRALTMVAILILTALSGLIVIRLFAGEGVRL
jgi:molybdate transport system permease protein